MDHDGPRNHHTRHKFNQCAKIPERNNKQIHDNGRALASHTYRRSIQETLACEDACRLHTQHPNRISSIRFVCVWETAPHAAATINSGFKPLKHRLGYVKAMKSHHPILTWHGIHQILHPKALPWSLGQHKAGRISENTATFTFRIQTCPYPGRLAYIHGLPFIIVGKRHHSMRYGRP